MSEIGAAVFYGSFTLQPSNKLAQVWIMTYRNEVFDRIFGGAIQLDSNNVPMTIIDNSKFINCFGKDGAAISFNKGGALFIAESEFVFEYEDEEVK